MTTLPNDRSPQRLGARLVASLGLVLAIAGSLAQPEERSIEGLATRVSVLLPDWLVIASVAALSISSLTFIAMAWSRRRRRQDGEDDDELQQEPQRTSPALAMFFFVLTLTPPVLLAWAIIAQSDGSGIWRLLTGVPLSHVVAQFDAEPAVPASPVTNGLIGTIALLAGFGSLVLVLWFRFGAQLHRRPGVAGSREPLANAVEDSLEDLQREVDPRTAIIKIYSNFELALAGVDVARRPWQTPIEFMHSALTRMPLPPSAVASITRLFELARFSHHRLGAEERDSAWRSLSEIRAALDSQKQASDVASS